MRKMYFFITVLIILAGFISSSQAQTPTYYNSNTGTSGNSFPFNVAGGKAVNSLILAGELSQPTPVPAGQKITTVYFRNSGAGTRTYTNLRVLMAQDVITTLTSATFYGGPYDTVYFNASPTFTTTVGGWMSITLDHGFNYDVTKSLILFVEQCGATGAGGSVYNSSGTDIRRTWSVGGCPTVPYAGGDASIVNFGVDVVPVGPSSCSNFSHGWTTGLAVLPDGATNASRVIPSGVIINDTGYVYVMGGGSPVNINRCYNTVTNTWSTKTAMPVALATTNGTTIKDSIYVIGGYLGAAGTSGAVYKYNPRTDSWVTKASMPVTTMTADMGIVPWRDSLIICVGGGSGLFAAAAATNAVRYFNVYTNTWTTLAGTFPVQMGMMACSIVGDTIFTFGGYDYAGTTVGTAYRGIITPGNPISITWSTIAPIPATFNLNGTTYRSSAATIRSVNGGVLIVGGANSLGAYNGTAYVYNPCSNTYTTLTSTTGSSKSNMGGRLYAFRDSVVYLAGGYNATGQTSILKLGARCYYCNVTGVGNIGSTLPIAYNLAQNYPNPFNPTTKISFAIPKSGLTTIKVYDVLGKEVATLVNETKAAGNYIIDFNASSFSSGVYYYRLEVNGFIDTKKMTLIK